MTLALSLINQEEKSPTIESKRSKEFLARVKDPLRQKKNFKAVQKARNLSPRKKND